MEYGIAQANRDHNEPPEKDDRRVTTEKKLDIVDQEMLTLTQLKEFCPDHQIIGQNPSY